jgi:hypothetical protein
LNEPEPQTEVLEAARPATSAKVWLDRITESCTKFEKWREQCANLDKLYSRNERADSADREYALFWSNIEVLKPATYARTPVPVVAPRFKDGNAVAREASETLERCLVVQFEQADLDGLMREVRDDFLRYGRGTAWVRLAGDDDALAFDAVDHRDFCHELGRRWREVTWVARRAWLTRDDGVKRFGDAYKRVPLKKRDENAAIPDRADKAPVWEVWSKAEGCVYWVAEGLDDEVLDHKTPEELGLLLRDFWPMPKPAYGTLVPNSLLPVPEIRQYKDQIEEINEYTARIAALSDSLRVRGFYPAGSGDLSEAIEVAVKSTDDRAVLIPVSSAAAMGTGGFANSIAWLPVGEIAKLVQALVELRRVVIDDVYQIMGIADILRGQTDPNETKGAQQLKSQWGSLRMRERQNELVRFARDLTRIGAEIISENFAPEVIFEMAQVQLLPEADKQQLQMEIQQAEQQAQQAAMMAQQQGGQPPPPPPPPPKAIQKQLEAPSQEEVAELLKNDRTRGFVIEIETDSTIQPDEDAEKARRIEAVTAFGGYLTSVAPIVQQMPMLGPFVVEVFKFGAQAFRSARPLEAAIDQMGEAIEGMVGQQQGPPPDPLAEAKAQAELKRVEIEEKRFMELEGPKAKAELDIKQGELELKQQELQLKARGEERADKAEVRADRVEDRNDRAFMRDGFAMRREATNKDREHGLKERAQTHTETAHRDTLQDGKAAREAEDTFRRDEKGVRPRAETDEREAGRDQALSAMADALSNIKETLDQPPRVRLIKGADGRTAEVERNGERLPVRRDGNTVSIG